MFSDLHDFCFLSGNDSKVYSTFTSKHNSFSPGMPDIEFMKLQGRSWSRPTVRVEIVSSYDDLGRPSPSSLDRILTGSTETVGVTTWNMTTRQAGVLTL